MSRLNDIAARHLAKVIESSDDAIVSKDLNSIITSWNPGAERIFGYTAEEAIGKSIRMLIPAHLQGEEDMVLARIRAGEKVDHYETIRQRKDGTPIAISLTVSPIRDDQGTIIGASKIARDVTDRTRLEVAAREHASNTQKLSDVGAVVASTLDREAIVQRVTDTATDLTRAEFGAFFYNVRDQNTGDAYMLYALSGAPREAFSAFPHPRATAVFGPTFRGEAPVRIDDVMADTRYGKSAPFYGMPPGHLPVRSYLAVPVKGLDGHVIGGLFFGHSKVGVFDEQHERLAVGTAAWASVALENARLFAEAQEANRMKDDFLAVLSHELRTPLNAILGYSRLLRSNMLNGEQFDRAIETVERNSRWLTQIVEDVLDVSRIVSGKIRLDVQAVNLPSVIDNAVSTIQPTADAKNVRLQTLIDTGVAPVSGDPDRLQQVIWNLLSNAVKFTPSGGHVSITARRTGDMDEIIVSDSGIGIDAAFLPNVFESFRQADASTTRAHGGLGLGLSIVKQLVGLHGGEVLAQSEGKDLGATFTVRLPVRPVERRRAEDAAPIPIDSMKGRLRGRDILVVDDDADTRELLVSALEGAGGRVRAAASSSEALSLIRQRSPEAVVSDIGMPGEDGYVFMQRLTRDFGDQTPKVRIALSAFAAPHDREHALDAGFQRHVAKPVDPHVLIKVLEEMLDTARVG